MMKKWVAIGIMLISCSSIINAMDDVFSRGFSKTINGEDAQDVEGARILKTKSIHERMLVLILDRQCQQLLTETGTKENIPVLLGCLGFYFAVVRDILNIPDNPVLFVEHCRSFLSDGSKCKEFIEEDNFKKIMSVAFSVNVWNAHLTPGDDEELSDGLSRNFTMMQEYELDDELTVYLSFANPSMLARSVMLKLKQESNPVECTQTKEVELLEAIFRGNDGEAVLTIRQIVRDVFDNYNATWAGWFSLKKASCILL